MAVNITRSDGNTAAMYRGVGEIIIGSDEDFTETITLNTASFMRGLEKLGLAIIVVDGGDL